MRAVRIDSFGGPEVLVPVDVPDPVPGPGEVLVRIAAAGVNRADALLRAGLYHRAGRPPLVPGVEAAGVVVEVGEGVTEVVPGQRVMALDGGKSSGFYARLATVPATHLVVLPEAVDLTRAAALPVAWLSAWYCLRRLARVTKDDTVVVKAAASGVGTAAVQIAAETGARVIALAGSAEKAAWAGEFGADVTLDTSAPAWAGEFGADVTLDTSAHPDDAEVEEVLRLTDGRGADVVLDTVGGRAFGRSLREVAHGGRVVALANVALEPSTVDTRDFYPKNASILGFQLTNLQIHGYDPRPDLRELAERVAAGVYRVPIETVVPLEEARAAHERLERRDNRGKIVLAVGPDISK
ncbi:quinone oxidoreductase family protein [Streptomyces sp. SLBN-8D4]|uniref:quinone oxidoreductase family protein n=1 Tax=Streptomyces sp. SLBN-8D4 TaxID=3377728 RepID=UPI003C7B1163